MKINAAVAAELALLSALAASADAEERETRDLTGFNAVAVGSGIDLTLRQGEPFRVEVSAPDGELAKIVTEVRGNTLDIRRERSGVFGWWGGGDSGSVSVTLPAIVAVTASGGSDVRAEGTLSGTNLELVASGGSDLTVDIAVTTLEITASGGSDVDVSGSARTASVQSSGGSDLNASRLAVDEADVHSSGGSDLSIEVREKLVANASGGSDINYSGQPRDVEINSSGGGGVRQR
jgi:hypothetical protein